MKKKKGVRLFVDEEGGKHEKVPDKVPSIRELRKICQRKRNVWFWRDRIDRFFSIYLTKFFLYTGLTPNQITVIVMLLGIASAFFYMPGLYVYSLIGLFLHHFSFVLDAVDGEVARYRKMMSTRGVYLDLMTHIIVNPLLVLGMSIGAFMHPPSYLPFSGYFYLIVGGLGSFSMMWNNFLNVKKYELYAKKEKFSVLKNMVKKGKVESLSWIKNEIIFLLSFELFNLMFFFTILNLIPILVLFYGVLYFGRFLTNFYDSYRSVKEV